jgi:N6-adenosine-specific RNA methylase IME4
MLADLPAAIFDHVRNGTKKIADVIRERKRATIKADLEDISKKKAKEIEGVYDVVVIDPPWPIIKIERDERPNQSELDYPTMSEDELCELTIPTAKNCHVWLWTTHRFLPMAFHLLDHWGMKYVCAFVWHKPGGFQPIGLPQYNCEFALYARKGTPAFLDTKNLPVCFDAPRGKHSEKPSAFYETVKRITAGRRLDMFTRKPHDGFDSWGNEV